MNETTGVIPTDVLDALEEVRDSGATNMLNREAVIHLGDWQGFPGAMDWLVENEPRYIEALKAMGDRRAARRVSE